MSKQISTGYGLPPTAFLEHRIATLESALATLAEAVGVLSRGLEGTPLDRPSDAETAHAARLTHELLLAAGLLPPSHS